MENIKNKKITIWVFDSGAPGHLSQSKGLVKAIGKKKSIDVHYINTPLKVRGFYYKMLCFFSDYCQFFSLNLLSIAYKDINFPDGKPDLIISSCDKTTLVNAVIAKKFSALNVFLGYPNNFSVKNFFKIVTYHKNKNKNSIYCPILFNPINSHEAQLSAKKYFKQEDPSFLVLLFGGSTRSHFFTEEDIKNLSFFMNDFTKQTSLKWLVTTSQRSGLMIENALQKYLKKDAIFEMILYSKNPQKIISSYLGAAKMVFCTQDSLSMLSESIMSRKKVYAIYPNKVFFRKKDYLFTNFLKNAKNEKLIKPVNMNTLHNEVLKSDTFNKVEKDIFTDIADSILN